MTRPIFSPILLLCILLIVATNLSVIAKKNESSSTISTKLGGFSIKGTIIRQLSYVADPRNNIPTVVSLPSSKSYLFSGTRVVLTGSLGLTSSALVRQDGAFTISDVKAGNYLLEVDCPDYYYDPIIVYITKSATPQIAQRGLKDDDDSTESEDIDTATVKVASSTSSTSSSTSSASIESQEQSSYKIRVSLAHSVNTPLPYPLSLRPKRPRSWFEQRQSFNLKDFFANPMMIMVCLSVGLMVIFNFMPKDLAQQAAQQSVTSGGSATTQRPIKATSSSASATVKGALAVEGAASIEAKQERERKVAEREREIAERRQHELEMTALAKLNSENEREDQGLRERLTSAAYQQVD